jgi:hypothetical protein
MKAITRSVCSVAAVIVVLFALSGCFRRQSSGGDLPSVNTVRVICGCEVVVVTEKGQTITDSDICSVIAVADSWVHRHLAEMEPLIGYSDRARFEPTRSTSSSVSSPSVSIPLSDYGRVLLCQYDRVDVQYYDRACVTNWSRMRGMDDGYPAFFVVSVDTQAMRVCGWHASQP